MFATWRRAKAVTAATRAATILLRLKERYDGIPEGFWQDPYVLGYFGGTIAATANSVTGDRIHGTDLGYVLRSTFERLFGSRAEQVWRAYLDASKEMTDDFRRGILNADKVVLVAHGSRAFDEDEHVVSARTVAKQLSRETALALNTVPEEASSVAGVLTSVYFMEETRTRFGQRVDPDT